jgi:hypothetical protein
MNDATMTIAAMEAREACKGETDLMERIRKAMKAVRNHWMVTDESQQFRAAIAAAILESSGDERDRIERSAKELNRVSVILSAFKAGVPVDVEAMEPPAERVIPLTKMWREAA